MRFEIWQLLLMLGAACRLTRLVVDDTLLIPFREWVENKESAKRGWVGTISFTTLINCTWCAGVWVSAGVIGLSVAWEGFFWVWASLSLSLLIGWEAVVRERLEVD